MSDVINVCVEEFSTLPPYQKQQPGARVFFEFLLTHKKYHVAQIMSQMMESPGGTANNT